MLYNHILSFSGNNDSDIDVLVNYLLLRYDYKQLKFSVMTTRRAKLVVANKNEVFMSIEDMNNIIHDGKYDWYIISNTTKSSEMKFLETFRGNHFGITTFYIKKSDSINQLEINESCFDYIIYNDHGTWNYVEQIKSQIPTHFRNFQHSIEKKIKYANQNLFNPSVM
jgi:hypothetical protein